MRHDSMVTIAVLAFLANLSAGALITWVYSMVGVNAWALIGASLGSSAFVSLAIVSYYTFFGGFPITKRQIDETLGGLKE